MKNKINTLYVAIISLITYIFVSCNLNTALTDLTPDDGFNTEFAFNVLEFKASISETTEVSDTGWYAINPVENIKIASPFVPKKTYIATDTFAFEWHDYEVVLDSIQKIANGFDIRFSKPHYSYRWMSTGIYSNGQDYLIPVFNSKKQRYWIQVFREQKSFFKTYYTARGLWIIGEDRPIDGDVS